MRKPLRSAGFGLLAAILGITVLPGAPAGASVFPGDWAHYYIQNRYSGRCIDQPGGNRTPGIQLQQYSCNGTPAQDWQFGQVGGYWWIVNTDAGGTSPVCIQDQGGWVGSGVPALQWYCGSTPDLEWTLVPVPGLYMTYYIENLANNNRCLGIPDWGVNDHDPLEVLDCNGGADQQWILISTQS